MKIVHVLCSDRKGGLERAFLNLNRLLCQLGHEVEVWLPGSSPFFNAEDVEGCRLFDFNPRGYYDVFSMLRANKRLRTLKPDLIITHNARATSILGHARIATGIPLCAFSHSNKLKRMLNADFLVCLTVDMQSKALGLGIDRDRLAIMPNFTFERPEYTPRANSGNNRVGFIGRMTPEKGLDILLRAFAKALGRLPSAELHIAGEGDDSHHIQAAAIEAGIAGKVHLHGWVSDVDTWLKNVDLLVVPSLSETFGIVVLEARLQGCPVIASDVSGPASQITSGEDGWLVAPGDENALADAIVAVLNDPAARARVAEAGYRRSAAYTADVLAPELEALLERARHCQGNRR